MSFKLLGGGSDLNGVVSDMNQNILEMKGREVTEVFKDDTGTRRVLSGKRGDDYGLFVSKPTFDVFTAADDELSFNSNQNVFKIVDTGTSSVTAPEVSQNGVGSIDGSGTTTVNHSLGFVPVVLAFIDYAGDGSQYLPLNYTGSFTGGGALINEFVYTYTDSTTVTFVAGTSIVKTTVGIQTINETTYPIKYYLLQETAN